MTTEEMIDVMLDAARKYAIDSGSEHPEDLATAMSIALDVAAIVLEREWLKTIKNRN